MKTMLKICWLLWLIPALWANEDTYATLPIGGIGHERLAQLESDPQLTWWVELNSRLLVAAPAATIERLKRDAGATPLPIRAKGRVLAFARLGREGLPKGAEVLVQEGRMAVLLLDGATDIKGDEGDLCRHGHTQLAPFAANTVLLRDGANHDLPAHRAVDPTIQNLVDQVNSSRWFADVSHLATYNRWTRGGDILNARDWLVAQFSALPNLQVTTQSFSVSGDTAWNVIATLPGTTRPQDLYIVGAHYDAISEHSSTAAPGAEDNGSGTAAVLEMARIFSGIQTEGTVVFICYAGEEQGLYGSYDHAGRLVSQGQASHVKAALIMDMIAYASNTNQLTVLLETGNIASFLFTPMITAAQDYTQIDTATSLNPFGSDHIPYLQNQMPALLTIENDYDFYPAYHRSNDLPQNLVIPMGLGIIQLNVATLASLAGVATVVEGNLLAYVSHWNQPVTLPNLHDFNANGLTDVLDLVDRVNRL